jgi:hypothetical protein
MIEASLWSRIAALSPASRPKKVASPMLMPLE